MLRNLQVYLIRICIISLCNTIYLSDSSGTIWNRNNRNITRYKRQLNYRDSCLIPENPQNGKYTIGGLPEGSYKPGDYVIQFSAIIVSCNPNYKLNPPQRGVFSLCINGNWAMPPPTCSRSCPSINSTLTRTVTCRHADCPLKPCNDPIEGTIANLECEPSYEEPEISRNPTRICRNGSWDYPIQECLSRKLTSTIKHSKLTLSCLIPENPQNGKYTIGGLPEGSYKPGDYAIQFSIMTVSCNPRYKPNPLQNGSLPFCINGNWTMPPPTCARSCPPIKSTSTTTVKCRHAGRPLQSCNDPVEGTIARVECEPLFEQPAILKNPNRICRDGSWDSPIPECLPICGQKRPQGLPHIIGGQIAKHGDYPWHIGIYTANKSYTCGGSLLNQRIVLSAAHCFTNNNGKLFPKNNYLIAAGKYYREYSDPRDEQAQYSVISEIRIPERYRGTINNFEADIAIIILTNKLNITVAVQPVCVDWQTEFEYLQLQENNVGVVTGWDLPEDYQVSKPSEELKELRVLHKSHENCSEQVSEEFRKCLTHDKACAGYTCENQFACQDVSGGGLSFAWNQNRYYIRGIVSTSPSTKVTGVGSRDANQYATYTLVSKYINFIKDLEIIATMKRSGISLPCLIPENPQNGKYTIGGLPEGSYKPGDYAIQFSIMTVSCNPRYKPNPMQNGSFPFCINGNWTMPPPTCARSCPPIKSTSTTTVKCRHAGRPLQTCNDPVEGTIARVECEPLFEEPAILKNPNRICRDGSWDSPIPECLPICGQKRPQGLPHIIGGQIAKHGDYPWHIGIYTANKSYTCGGSLLNQRIVLSAAHCFTNNDGKLFPKNNYLIAAGKYYREYSDPRDEQAQYSVISEIYVPERYRGAVNNFEADIAVIILTNKLDVTFGVQPVCVDWNTEFEYLQLQENNVGVVTGWGFTVPGSKSSEELKELDVPYKSYADCYEDVPKNFRKFLTHDKLCAGYTSENQSICQSVSGEGLSFAWNQNRYYIRGVVSISPSSKIAGVEPCVANEYGTYTLVSKYIDFIKDLELKYRI